MEINKIVEKIIKKYKSTDPYKLAKEMNTIVMFEPLGSYRGYYNKIYRQKFIHINQDLDEIQKKITCAHELGHSVLHSNTNTPFMRNNTFYSMNKLERQANLFAAYLLIDDNFLNENREIDIIKISETLNLPIELIHIKLNAFNTFV